MRKLVLWVGLFALAAGMNSIPSSAAFATVIATGFFESAPIGAQELADAQGSPAVAANRVIQEYDTSDNLAHGATVTVSGVHGGGFELFHDASGVTDGYYGNGSAWIGASANSWLEIDLGQTAVVDQILFGRYRVGSCCNDRQAGRFKLEAAPQDHIFSEVIAYTAVSYPDGQSVKVDFTAGTPQLISARYLRLTFENDGTGIDEVEVFGVIPEPSTALLLGLGLAGTAAKRAGVMRQVALKTRSGGQGRACEFAL
jgi:hypothetical protein